MADSVNKINELTEDDLKGPWTEFYDMRSGGGKKEKFGTIYIQAPEDAAEVIFYNRFDHSPRRVTCTCCGSDYSISELNEIPTKKLEDKYFSSDGYIFIRKQDIKDEERKGKVPDHGYIWVD